MNPVENRSQEATGFQCQRRVSDRIAPNHKKVEPAKNSLACLLKEYSPSGAGLVEQTEKGIHTNDIFVLHSIQFPFNSLTGQMGEGDDPLRRHISVSQAQSG